MKHIKKFNESEGLAKVVEVRNTDDGYIVFDNGYTLNSYHSQDCCESHSLDFEHISVEDFEGLEFDLSGEDFFKRIPDYGIELIPVKGWGVRIPGYGYNNGYYSSNLDLVLSDGKGNDKTFDISDCQEISE